MQRKQKRSKQYLMMTTIIQKRIGANAERFIWFHGVSNYDFSMNDLIG